MTIYLKVPAERRDELMIGTVKEHVGYDNDIIIRRSANNRFAVCLNMTTKEAPFSSGVADGIAYTIESDYTRWCEERGIAPFG